MKKVAHSLHTDMRRTTAPQKKLNSDFNRTLGGSQVNNQEDQKRKRILKIYTIVEKPGQEKGIWLEIGVGSENRDGSIRGKLDALPSNGMIHIREYEPKTQQPNDDPQLSSNKWQ
jgi:hypothetical protein